MAGSFGHFGQAQTDASHALFEVSLAHEETLESTRCSCVTRLGEEFKREFQKRMRASVRDDVGPRPGNDTCRASAKSQSA